MKYVLGVLLCLMGAACLGASCKSLEDSLERLACYEAAESCNRKTDSADRLSCFEGAYRDQGKQEIDDPDNVVMEPHAPVEAAEPQTVTERGERDEAHARVAELEADAATR